MVEHGSFHPATIFQTLIGASTLRSGNGTDANERREFGRAINGHS